MSNKKRAKTFLTLRKHLRKFLGKLQEYHLPFFRWPYKDIYSGRAWRLETLHTRVKVADELGYSVLLEIGPEDSMQARFVRKLQVPDELR